MTEKDKKHKMVLTEKDKMRKVFLRLKTQKIIKGRNRQSWEHNETLPLVN
jgi:hypothetical protein